MTSRLDSRLRKIESQASTMTDTFDLILSFVRPGAGVVRTCRLDNGALIDVLDEVRHDEAH